MRRWLLVALVVLPFAAAAAPSPSEMLDDPALEQRARAISAELRCVVCQNESIDASNAPLAADMRRLVRERLAAGDDDHAVMAYMTARYGDFVLLRPPVRSNTWLLWFGPAVVGALAASALVVALVRRRAAPAASVPLTAEEQRLVDDLLRERR
ncbi:MAG: cytochrome c-type biogenesis protein [Pseudomonadota bacterium]